MEPKTGRSWNKWHFISLVAFLYAVIIAIAFLTHQSPEVIQMLFAGGSAIVFIFLIALLGG